MPKKKTTKKVKKVEKKVVPKKSAIDLYLELEGELKIAFKKLCEKLTVSDLRKLADKSRIQKEFACSKLVGSSNLDALLTVVKRSFEYRNEAAQKIISKVKNYLEQNKELVEIINDKKASPKARKEAEDKLEDTEVSDDDLRTLIQKNACKDEASYYLEERKKARNRKKANE